MVVTFSFDESINLFSWSFEAVAVGCSFVWYVDNIHSGGQQCSELFNSIIFFFLLFFLILSLSFFEIKKDYGRFDVYVVSLFRMQL